MSESEVELVKMAVNQEVCIGAGQCEVLEEETFYIDDDTVIAGVIGTGLLPADRAEKVIAACPTQAISIESPSSETAAKTEEE